jgi:putative nucleotidyltransferase with HDIG domain
MEYNYQKILKQVKKIVLTANNSRANKYGPTVWTYHLEFVASYSLKLAKKLKADKEIVELAAYLHDYASLINFKNAKNHHVVGAEEAKKILTKLGLPEEKITAVAYCILNHRGSVSLIKKTKEEKIIASADAMSHFSCAPDMFLLAYKIHKFETYEGAVWLKNKLKRSWNKIIPEGQKMIKNKKNLFYKVLDQVLK